MSWKRFLRRQEWDRERARELDAYLEAETAENIARGMTEREARDAARRKLGSPMRVREQIYEMNTIGWLESLWQDLRYGARQLRRNPSFTLVAVLSLALGIGANTSIFQLLDTLRMRTLPVKDPGELVTVHIADWTTASGNFDGSYPYLTNPQWELLRQRQQAFSGMLAWNRRPFNLNSGGEARYADGLWVSGDFFQVLGVAPALGRVFTAADDRQGCGLPGVVISHGFWQREFGGDRSVLSKKLTLDGYSMPVIGVTPASFHGVEVGRGFDLAVPLCADATLNREDSRLDSRHVWWWLAAMGRLKPGWTMEKASAQLNTISAALFQETLPPTFDPQNAKDYLAYRLAAFPAENGFSSLRAEYETPLWLLLATAGVVLLIACANLANLMLARAAARGREIAVRMAMGASRRRVIRQLLAESLLLAALGALCGVLLAQNLSQFLVSRLTTEDNKLFVELTQDWRVLGFSAGLAVLTCVLFGLVPALRATRTAPSEAMKAGGRGMTESHERFGLRRVLVVAQVALSLVLMAGAALFASTLRNLLTLDPGFQQDGILSIFVDFSRLNLPKERRVAYQRDVLERIRAVPGVDAAAEVLQLPLAGLSWTEAVLVNEKPVGISSCARVSTGYFDTLRVGLLAGRDFGGADTATSPKVAIVNESFASRYFNGADPIGRTFRFQVGPQGANHVYQIVGLVKNTKYLDLREKLGPIAYFPDTQEDNPLLFARFAIRSRGSLVPLTAALKQTMGEASPNIQIHFQVYQELIRESLLREQLMATLSGFFGVLAGMLATIGLYGVMSYNVARRTNEIGIRMALGADRRSIVGMVIEDAGLLVAVGLATGTLLALLATTQARDLLYGLESFDARAHGMAVILLAAVALAAAYLPARRAAALDPMAARRDE